MFTHFKVQLISLNAVVGMDTLYQKHIKLYPYFCLQFIQTFYVHAVFVYKPIFIKTAEAIFVNDYAISTFLSKFKESSESI